MTTSLPVRNTDPDTSRHAAVSAVRRRPTIRNVVHVLMRSIGPVTLDDLVGAYAGYRDAWPDGVPAASASSIRTRCSELVRDGLVEVVPDAEGVSANGHRAKLWRVVA